MAQYNGANPQAFRIYNTTDGTNLERAFLRWNTNVFEIGTEAAGTGTQRQLAFPLGTVTASTPLSITQTWNSAGVTFGGLLVNITDTASGSNSTLVDLQIGGSSKFSIRKDGLLQTAGSIFAGNANSFRIGWNDGLTGFYKQANHEIEQRSGTNPQAFRVFNTYTDNANYERAMLAWSSNELLIGTQSAGTGSARALKLQTGGTTRAGITTTGNVYVGSGAASLATTATDGFLHIPTCAGAPTGVPTAITGCAPLVADSTNNKVYCYLGGAWVALN